jgi:hypothetical protein
VDRSATFRVVLSLAVAASLVFAPAKTRAAESEIGPNDFRLSWMNPGTDPSIHAFHPAVAFSAVNKEFLAVWEGDPGGTGEFEIHGQRLNGLAGAMTGASFRISAMGPDADSRYQARTPAVAWNAAANEYLVVWRGDTSAGGLVDNEFEIFGQRISATSGTLVGSSSFRISAMGPDGDASYAALCPAVAWNSRDNRYLVVWYGDTNTGGAVNGDLEIFGQMLDGAGAAVGSSSLRLTFAGGGTAGNGLNATHPAIAYNTTSNEFLLAYEGDEAASAQEIWVQRLDGLTGAATGSAVRASRMGASDADTRFNAFRPSVAWSSQDNRYLVAWHGSDDVLAMPRHENEVFGRFLSGATAEIVGDQFRITHMGPDGNDLYGAYHATVAYDKAVNGYLASWEGNDEASGLALGEREVFGQLLRAGGAPVASAARISATGPDGNAACRAQRPALAQDTLVHKGLVVWQGNSNAAAVSQFETSGQLLAEQANSVSRPGYSLGIFQAGALMYNDRTYVFSAPIPAQLDGQLYIVGRNDEKDLTGADFLSFRVEAPVTIYVALADTIATPPSWLGTWDLLPDALHGRKLYAKKFLPGLVSLGPNRDEGMPTGKSMYSVIITATTWATNAEEWVLY